MENPALQKTLVWENKAVENLSRFHSHTPIYGTTVSQESRIIFYCCVLNFAIKIPDEMSFLKGKGKCVRYFHISDEDWKKQAGILKYLELIICGSASNCPNPYLT